MFRTVSQTLQETGAGPALGILVGGCPASPQPAAAWMSGPQLRGALWRQGQLRVQAQDLSRVSIWVLAPLCQAVLWGTV